MKIRHRRGTATVMMIVVSVVLTGLVMALAASSSAQTQNTNNTTKRNAAFYAAEAGAEKAYWKFKHDSTYRAPANAPLTGTITMGNADYTYSATVIGTGNAVQIQSTSSLSSLNGVVVPANAALSFTCCMAASSGTYVPALAINNNMDKTGHIRNLTVNGDMMVQNDL